MMSVINEPNILDKLINDNKNDKIRLCHNYNLIGIYLCSLDLMQEEIGSCSIDDISVRVMTRVIGRYPERSQIIIDAGWTALSKQGPLNNGSHAVFQGYPGLK